MTGCILVWNADQGARQFLLTSRPIAQFQQETVVQFGPLVSMHVEASGILSHWPVPNNK